MNKEKKEVVKVNQITEGVIWQQILIFFLPILFGTFFQQLYNTADAMIVGHFLGKQALAAVGGTTGTLINLLVGFFVGLSSGATVVISQHYGANKEDKVQWAVHTSIAFSILGGIVLTVVGIGCSRWMLDLMNTPDDVVNHALIYMRVYFLGTIGNLIYNMGSGILRAVGDSKRPLLYLIICCSPSMQTPTRINPAAILARPRTTSRPTRARTRTRSRQRTITKRPLLATILPRPITKPTTPTTKRRATIHPSKPPKPLRRAKP